MVKSIPRPKWAKHPDGSPRKLTLLGRSILLVGGELLANAICWIAAGICFRDADGLLGLALLAWTIGLRHGLDADHISAIDNATRQLVSLGQLPITCGLFFSLGHSTIVIVVNIAIAVSVDIYDKLDKVGSVGGIIGASVSSSFLFLIACINIYFLIGAIRQRRAIKQREQAGLPIEDEMNDPTKIHGGGCMVRIIRPVLRAVDRSWKMYPVGVLFGFGFDTASSIALLAISAVAQRGPNGKEINHGKIVILPFLFTAGMSLVDSLDSILMLYAYATPSTDTPEGKLALLQSMEGEGDSKDSLVEDSIVPVLPSSTKENVQEQGRSEIEVLEREDQQEIEMDRDQHKPRDVQPENPNVEISGGDMRTDRLLRVKTQTMSNLSIILTLLSILVALSISLITMMGLIGENCQRCTEAAEDPNGGGLAGSWWRAWFRANDQSGYIGAAIVGCFAAILFSYYGVRYGMRKYKEKKGGVVLGGGGVGVSGNREMEV